MKMKMIVKPRPALGCWAVKSKGVVAFKGTEDECLAFVAAAGAEVVRQEAGKGTTPGERPPRAPRTPRIKTARRPRWMAPEPTVIDGVTITHCPPAIARGGRSKQLRR
jgi:hypothetical protein